MNRTKKISIIQIIRLIVQIVFFVILPGIYVNAFAGIKHIYLGIINGSFNLADSLPQLVEVMAVIPATIILGRFFCGWMCAFGTLGDMIYHVSRKVFKASFKINEKSDRVLKYFKFVILGFLITVVWTFDISAFSSASPWNAFGIVAAFGKIPDISYAFTEFTVGSLILLAIIAASFFIERFFCRYLCPLGAIFTIISRLKLVKINKPSEKCGSCRICTNSCVMGIPLYKYNKINSGECIHCFKCVSACPRDNSVVNIGKDEMLTGAAAALAVTCMSSVYFTGSYVSKAAGLNNISSIASSSNPGQPSEGHIYSNGTYEGSGIGFRGAATTVSVTVENDTIKDIQVVSYGDDAPYFERAYNSVASQIISSQSPDVDAVSGATFSSNGIMDAVSNALEKAKTSSHTATAKSDEKSAEGINTPVGNGLESTPAPSSDRDKPSESNTSKGEPADNQTIASATAAKEASDSKATSTQPKAAENTPDTKASVSSIYKDGTYQGSARGFRRGTTRVSVVIKNDKITDIQIISHGDDRPYFNAATSVISEILEAQSTDVDAVSGATYSSMGIMNAVEDALGTARIS